MALSHAILSALAGQSCSGYDLAKQFDGSVGFFWRASHQQIYRELSKLEDKAWLQSKEIRQEGRPDKKLYELTDKGKACLQEWIMQPSSLPPIKDELLVKLFSGHLVPTASIKPLLHDMREQHVASLEAYLDIEQQYFSKVDELPIEMRFQYLTLRNGIYFEQGWLAWVDEAIAALETFPDAESS